MEYDEFIQGAEKLLLSTDFKELQAALEFPEPNIWRILGISRRETLVTRFLVWLLNPQSRHSFGDQFLKSFIAEALRTDIGRQSGLTWVEIAVMDLSDTEVKTEYWLGRRRCDVLVYSEGSGLICIIENKIGAKESQDQTKNYYELSFARFGQEQYPSRIYIYLSPAGDPPQSDHFISLSYQAVLDVIGDLRTRQQVTETELFLLRQFQENVRRSVAMDRKTVDLAQAIYDSHRDVLDFIYEHAERPSEECGDGEPPVWDGKSWFFNIGEVGETPYSWEDCRKYSFICAGGGQRYRRLMENFNVGDIIYAYVSGSGYVGVGTVMKAVVPFRDAALNDGRKLADLALAGTYNGSNDDDMCDWIALVEWKSQVEKSQAVRSKPIVPATAARVYEHRKDFVNQVREELEKKSGLITGA